MHSNNTLVAKGRKVAGTRAIPLIVKRDVVNAAIRIGKEAGGIIGINKLRIPKVGVVITGNEVYSGRVNDSFAPVIRKKIEAVRGEIVGIAYAPDDVTIIADRLRELFDAGADLLITTGGMSVDPDDVTRFAIGNLGARDITYGSAMLPGAMFLVAYLERTGSIPILVIPASGMYANTTILILSCRESFAERRSAEESLRNWATAGFV